MTHPDTEGKTVEEASLAVEVQTLETVVALQASITSLAHHALHGDGTDLVQTVHASQAAVSKQLDTVKELLSALKRREEAKG